MKLFFNTRAKRKTALAVLLVWLFAVASGVAHACLLEGPGTHSQIGVAGSAKTGHAPAELRGHFGASTSHDDEADITKESCLKVCDDGTRTLPKAYAGVDHTDPGPPPLVTTLWTGSPPVASAPRRVDDLAIPIVGPPFRVRYSRLAL